MYNCKYASVTLKCVAMNMIVCVNECIAEYVSVIECIVNYVCVTECIAVSCQCY